MQSLPPRGIAWLLGLESNTIMTQNAGFEAGVFVFGKPTT